MSASEAWTEAGISNKMISRMIFDAVSTIC